MKTITVKTIAAGLVAGLILAAGAQAQMGQMNGMSHKGGMMQGRKSGSMMQGNMMGGMMGPMKMSGSVTMNDKTHPVQCRMAPVGKSKGMMGMMGNGSMGNMKMDHPMKMAGTITMMGRTYHCTMTMTPQGK